MVTTGVTTDGSASAGFRNGSESVCKRCSSIIRAPGGNDSTGSAASSGNPVSAGYAFSNTWNPRSILKPSMDLDLTRPPTVDERSRTRTRTFLSARRLAQARPAKPAPMIVTFMERDYFFQLPRVKSGKVTAPPPRTIESSDNGPGADHAAASYTSISGAIPS